MLGSRDAPSGKYDGSFETGDFHVGGWTAAEIQYPFFNLSIYEPGVTPEGFGFFRTTPTDGFQVAATGFDGGTVGSMTRDTVMLSNFVSLKPTQPKLYLAFDYRAAWDMRDFMAATPRTFSAAFNSVQLGTLLSLNAGTATNDTGPITSVFDITSSVTSTAPIQVEFTWVVPEVFSGPAFFQLDYVRFLCCPEGTISIAELGIDGSVLCQECIAGYGNTSATDTCEACRCGWTSRIGQPCAPCPVNQVAETGSGCYFCPDGSGPSPDQCTCLDCQAGSFSKGGDPCAPCALGTYSNYADSSCHTCGCGFQPNSTLSGCELCLPGNYSKAGSVCQRCPDGQVSLSAGACSCITCGAGYEPNATQSGCIPCPPGYFSRDGGVCQPCPAGSISSGADRKSVV